MAKRIVAAVTIKRNGNYIQPGDEIDHTAFTRDELTRLYERGAVRVEVEEEKRQTPTEVADSSEEKATEETQEEQKSEE